MQIWAFDPLTTFSLDVIAWLIVHFGLGYLCNKIPIQKFDPKKHFYQTQPWEKDGSIYQRLFKVRAWKHLIPQGSRIYKNAFSLQHLKAVDPSYLQEWLQESIRAEFCHWIMMIPGFFFFLWNGVIAGLLIMAYALVTNLIPIILQRYNRPRIQRLLSITQKRVDVPRSALEEPF